MTDVQLMTLAMAIVIPLSLLLYSNSRITDAKETLRAEMAVGNGRITEMKETLRAEMATGNNRITEMKETLHAEIATSNNRMTDVNDRITDVKQTLHAEMAATTGALRAEMAAGFSRISSEILSLKADLKVHELEHHHK